MYALCVILCSGGGGGLSVNMHCVCTVCDTLGGGGRGLSVNIHCVCTVCDTL